MKIWSSSKCLLSEVLSAKCYEVKVISLPLSSMCSVHKEPLFLQWDISKLAERGKTESKSECLHLICILSMRKVYSTDYAISTDMPNASGIYPN